MTQTQFYKLNSWAAEDRILRTDFNADNAKLDTALHTLDGKTAALEGKIAAERTYCNDKIAGERTHTDSGLSAVNNSITQTRTYAEGLVPIVKLMDITTTANANQVDLDISGIRWERYSEVLLSAQMRSTTGLGLSLNVRLDNDSSDSYMDFLNGRRNNFMNSLIGNEGLFCITAHFPYTERGFYTQTVLQENFSSYSMRFQEVCYSGQSVKLRSQFKTMNFICPNPIAAGAHITVSGVLRA